MAIPMEQIASVAFQKIEAEMNKPQNQWSSTAAMQAMKRAGFFSNEDLGNGIEVPVDYRQNPDVAVLAADDDATNFLKTETITSATYSIGQFNVPVKVYRGDEVKTPSVSQKIDFLGSLLENAYRSHDDLFEQLIFTSSTAGGDEIQGLNDLVPTSGQGTVGGINAAVETWWANPSSTYVDETDIQAAFTSIYNTIAKGSGADEVPKLILSGATPYALFESTQTAIQRWGDQREVNVGFQTLKFKNADYVFSQYGGNNIYFLNPKSYKCKVAKGHYRDKGPWRDIPGANGRYFMLYTAMQNIVTQKSRLGVLHL